MLERSDSIQQLRIITAFRSERKIRLTRVSVGAADSVGIENGLVHDPDVFANPVDPIPMSVIELSAGGAA